MIPLILISILALFALLAVLRDRLPWKICAICAAVSLTWFGLLVWKITGHAVNNSLPALLIGESVVGLYYLFERRVSHKYLIFRPPLLLTLTTLGFSVVTTVPGLTWLILAGVWLIWLIIFKGQDSLSRKTAYYFTNCCDD